jgi:hypothetical protein
LALPAYTSAMVRTRTQQTIGIITGEVVTFTVLTRDHLESRQPKKIIFCVVNFFLFGQGVFPSQMKFLHMCTITINVIKFQPKHTAQPITYDQSIFSAIRSHSTISQWKSLKTTDKTQQEWGFISLLLAFIDSMKQI